MENILIRGVNWLGDAVMSLPAVRGIRKLHPHSNISIIVKDKLSDLFKLESSVNEVIIYRERINDKIKLIKELKSNNFKRAYLLQNAFGASLITALAGIPERVGWNRDCRRFFLTHPVPYHGEDRTMHHIDYFFEIPKRFNPSLTPDYPWIKSIIEEKFIARKELKPLKKTNSGHRTGSKVWNYQKMGD